jgi:hypothetical protein
MIPSSVAATTCEDKALEVRASGKSFAAIAKTLGYERTHEANEAFNRALRRKSPAAPDRLRRQELTRLDAMTESVRASHTLGSDGIAQRLQTVERLRTMLLAE